MGRVKKPFSIAVSVLERIFWSAYFFPSFSFVDLFYLTYIFNLDWGRFVSPWIEDKVSVTRRKEKLLWHLIITVFVILLFVARLISYLIFILKCFFLSVILKYWKLWPVLSLSKYPHLWLVWHNSFE